MSFNFNKAFDSAFEPVSLLIFHDLIKTLTDGLPADLSSIALWTTDLIERQPSESEIVVATHLIFRIEDECRRAFFRLLFDPSFYVAFVKTMRKSQVRTMAKNKKRQATPFRIALEAAPNKSTKEILRDMEQSGVLEDNGEYYLLVDPATDRAQWKKIKKNSLSSKFSRLRRTSNPT